MSTIATPNGFYARQLGQTRRRRPDHAHRGSPAHRGERRREERHPQRRLHGHDVARPGGHPPRPRPARRLGLRAAHLRRLHRRARARFGARGRERARHQIPENANTIRNIMHLTLYSQDHLVHFYHLHALDWVDVVSALSADPVATSQLAQSISTWPMSSPGYFRDLQNRLTKFVESGTARALPQRLLGPPGLQAAAGGQPDGGRRTTSRRSTSRRRSSRSRRSSAARTRTRTGWSAACRRRSTWTTRARSARSTWNALNMVSGIIDRTIDVHRQRLHPRPARDRLVLQGLGAVSAAACRRST